MLTYADNSVSFISLNCLGKGGGEGGLGSQTHTLRREERAEREAEGAGNPVFHIPLPKYNSQHMFLMQMKVKMIRVNQ